MKKKNEFSLKEDISWEFFEAAKAVEEAERAFNLADENYIEVAILELRAAEMKLSAISRKMKLVD